MNEYYDLSIGLVWLIFTGILFTSGQIVISLLAFITSFLWLLSFVLIRNS